MTITIELSPEEDARLHAQAQSRGQAVEAVAGELVRAGLGNELAAPPSAEVTPEGLARLNQSLRDAGLLTEMPTHPGLTTLFQPITVSGPPVSQTLLEDRKQ